jgi:MSHA biogenesis protein MshO
MRRSAGFTLVELVMVIVILAIVALISVQFVVFSTQGALDLAARQQRALQAAVIGEQISRELRAAFPASIRVSDRLSDNCIEWLPIEVATTYIHLDSESDHITAAPFAELPPEDKTLYALVYNYGTTREALYARPNPGPVSPSINTDEIEVKTVDGESWAVIPLSAAHRFNQRSPQRRLFLVGSPISYCQGGRFLYRYSDYGARQSQPTPPAGATRAVLAANLTGPVQFEVKRPSLERGALVDFSFTLKDPLGEEETVVRQEVQIRNVP